MRKQTILLGILIQLSSAFSGYAQLTLEECRQAVRENYPLVKRYDLISRSGEYNLSNASRGYLPQVNLSAKASWQTEVTGLPVSLPGVEIHGLNKDQYQVVAEVQQTLWDGGRIGARKKQAETATEADRQQQEVDMYTLNDRTDQMFFGILLLEEQLKQNVLLQQELRRSYDQIGAYVANGIASQTDLDAVKVEQLNALQHQTELISTCGAYGRMLAVMTGKNLQQKQLPGVPQPIVALLRPTSEILPESPAIRRPELGLYDSRLRQYDAQLLELSARNRPSFSVFMQGGYGNPGLNMLKDEFSPWFLGGVRMTWNFGSLYTRRNEKRLITTGQEGIELQREVFLFNTRLEMIQENSDIARIRGLMAHDDEIIRLRGEILRSAEARVANGTLSVTELLQEINAGEQARQTKILHDIQLLMAIYNLKNTTNN